MNTEEERRKEITSEWAKTWKLLMPSSQAVALGFRTYPSTCFDFSWVARAKVPVWLTFKLVSAHGTYIHSGEQKHALF